MNWSSFLVQGPRCLNYNKTENHWDIISTISIFGRGGSCGNSLQMGGDETLQAFSQAFVGRSATEHGAEFLGTQDGKVI